MINNADKEILDKATAFAKKNKKKIALRITDKEIYTSESQPVSVFMAGSPGAGKTEASLELLEKIQNGVKTLRIDPDELRSEFKDYDGSNSYLFNYPVNLLVEKIHDLALKNGQSFLLDGTLSSFKVANQNIERSLKKGRIIQILYVYQDPLLAWDFVKAREKEEGRVIPPDAFVEHYFNARKTVNALKESFGKELKVDLLLKNLDNSNRLYKANIDRIDNHVPEKYTIESLRDSILDIEGKS